MTEKRKLSFPTVGGSSLLVIFAVLCLTVFALLTLSTVQANGRLSDRSAQAVLDYYQADTQAERILPSCGRARCTPGRDGRGRRPVLLCLSHLRHPGSGRTGTDHRQRIYGPALAGRLHYGLGNR